MEENKHAISLVNPTKNKNINEKYLPCSKVTKIERLEAEFGCKILPKFVWNY